MGEVDRLAQAAKLAEHFRSGTVSLSDALERIFEKQPGTDRVLIVIDQFEELYTLGSDDEGRRRFLDELLAASARTGSKANVVLTLRGDFVGSALAYRPLSDRLQDAQVNLGPMTREELECAIRKPAEQIRLAFEPGLVRRILNDVGDAPGNLPLLEFVLKELWDQRRGRLLLNETYDAIGGLQGAVATKADELLKGLSSAEQKILQRVFLRIVRPSESGLDTRRRAAFTELPPEGMELVVKLAKERLLVTNRSPSGLEQTVEVAHEALISNWSTLRGWVNEDREFLLWRERLGTLLAEWERAQESEEALLRGPLLTEAQKWFDQRSQDLSEKERSFINASRALREELDREEKRRQEKELAQARALVGEQKRLAIAEKERAEEAEKNRRLQKERAEDAEKRAKEQREAASKLRRLAWILGLVALAAAAAAIFALYAEQTAKDAEQTAKEQKALAGQRQVEAERQARLATEAQQTAEKQAVLARAAEDKAKQVASQANVFLALNFYAIGNYNQELAYLAKALRLNGRNSEAGALTAALLTQESWPVVTSAMKHDGAVWSAQFSPEGQRVVTASYDGTARVWDAATGKALGQPMKHDGPVNAAQFSPEGQRVVTASYDGTARVWDVLTITTKDSADDVNLLIDLAEATAGLALQAFGQTEILAALTPDQVKATRDRIAVKFSGSFSSLTPLQRFLKWSVANPRTRPISPFSDLTVTDWVNNRIKEGTLDGLRAAMFVDPANVRLAAHFGRHLADYVFDKGTNPDAARRARAVADTQTRRAVKLAPANNEVKTLRADVVKLLQLGPE
jgi:hypothetical protein